MLRFRSVADYSQSPKIAPESPISGREAYRKYMAATLPFLEQAGSRVIFFGKSEGFLIGPSEEKWDEVLLVEHESLRAFMAFANNPAYLKIAGHRTASLEDSRLLPILPSENF